jgi:hypothetical protein
VENELKYIEHLIAQGEGSTLDFKYNISDSRKIARSLVAFANTRGGTLLIGVKDNGAIAGIMSEEELFMLEAASNMYCKPVILFRTEEWVINHKTLLEVTIDESKDKPHYAMNDEGKWLAYIRHHDQNILANHLMLKVWERQKSEKATLVRYKKEEELLLHYLKSNTFITLNHFCHLANIPKYKAENILINLICLQIIRMEYQGEYFTYSLK